MSAPKSMESHVDEKVEAVTHPASTSGGDEEPFRDSRGSAPGNPQHEIASLHDEDDSSTPEYTSSSSESQIEVSPTANEADIESQVPYVPTDYEVFLAKSQAEYEKHRRDWVAIEIENESVGNKDGHEKNNPWKAFAIVRIIARAIQVFIRLFNSKVYLNF